MGVRITSLATAVQCLSLNRYLTIEVTRKLVLLLNTDPKSACIPLVGV